MSERAFQFVWRWRSFLWPFWTCRCQEHEGDLHVVYDGWPHVYFRRFTAHWGLSVVYMWAARVGPLEVRRWVPEHLKAERLRKHNEFTRGSTE